MTTDNTKQLLEVLNKYAVPDPKIVGKLPKGGTQLDFVGHADITRILLEIDPLWRWFPIAWDNGRPAIHVENGIATMWAELTILGHSRLGVGSVRADKQELDKELVGDFLRNAAMRFGICLSLWTKQEWEDLGGKSSYVTTTRTTGQAQQRTVTDGPVASEPAARPVQPTPTAGAKPKPKTLTALSEEQVNQFNTACETKGVNPKVVAANAGIPEGTPWMESHLPALRSAFKELVSFKDGE